MLETTETKNKRDVLFFLIVATVFLVIFFLGGNFVLSSSKKTSNIGEILPGIGKNFDSQNTKKIALAGELFLTKDDIDLPMICEPVKIDQGNLINCELKINKKVDNQILPEKGVRSKLVKFQQNSGKKPRIESVDYPCVMYSEQNLIRCDLRPLDIDSGDYFVDLIFGEEWILNVVQGFITIN